MKKLIKIYDDIISSNLDGLTVDEAIDFLKAKQSYLKELCPEYERIDLFWDGHRDDFSYLEIRVFRFETDKEYSDRLRAEKEIEERKARKQKEYEVEKERVAYAKYLKLKEKFGDK